MSAWLCECGAVWNSQTARDECRIIDDIEDRDARRPDPRCIRTPNRWDND